MGDRLVVSSNWRSFISTGIRQPFSQNTAIDGPYPHLDGPYPHYVAAKKAALKLSRLMKCKVYIYSFCPTLVVEWGSKKGKKKGKKS